MMRILPDSLYLRLKYFIRMKKMLNIKRPQTFNEKLQWLKLHDRNPEYTKMVDKYEVRKYIAEKIGEEHLIPLLGVWDSFEEIDFDKLPAQFVLKCTHDSGGLVVCKDKSKLNLELSRKKINKCLKTNYYWHAREWPYKNVKPRIIAEQLMKDGDNNFLPVYKFFCFSGVPKIIQTIQNDKQPNESIDYFDTDWKLLNIRQNYPNSEAPMEKPEQLSKMLKIVECLSKGIKFVRVDLYSINNKVYFSEFTFYSDAGFAKFHPEKQDYIIGSYIDL